MLGKAGAFGRAGEETDSFFAWLLEVRLEAEPALHAFDSLAIFTLLARHPSFAANIDLGLGSACLTREILVLGFSTLAHNVLVHKGPLLLKSEIPDRDVASTRTF